jgi:hypothetical protein
VRRLFAALLAIALFGPAEARAAPSRVLVVRPANADVAVEEALLRLHAELSAAGFDVIEMDAVPGKDARAQVEGARLEPRPFATIALAGTGAAADVWVADHLSGKTLVRRVDAGAPRSLAIHAVELLRASLLEIQPRPPPAPMPADVAQWMNAGPSPPTPLPAPAPPPAPRAAAPPGRIELPLRAFLDGPAFEAGLALVHGFQGLGTAIAPTARVLLPLPADFALRLSFLHTVAAPDLFASGGSASLRHDRIAIEALRVFGGGDARVRPLLSLGAGPWALHAEGHGEPGHASRATTAWSFAADAGVGLAIRALDWLALAADVHAVFLLPEPVVRIAGAEAGRAGVPMLLVDVTVLVAP